MRKQWWVVAAIVVAAVLVPQAVIAAVGSFSSNNATPAVIGNNTMTGTGQSPGGRFTCKANGCRGVHAISNGVSNGSYGVYASAKDPGGRALAGFNTATVGTAIGLSGQSDSTAGRGLNGLALASTGTNYGGYLETRSRSDGAAGVFGYASSTASTGAGRNYGVFGQTNGSGDDTSGVFGLAPATAGDPITNGVWGDAPSAGGTGVYGTSTGGVGLIGLGGFAGTMGLSTNIGVAGDTETIADGSYGLLSFTDAGIAGHLVGRTGHLVGTCSWTGSVADTSGCTFTVPFPGDGPEPMVFITPLGDPGGRWWVSSFQTDVNGDFTGFTATRSDTSGGATIQWLAIGVDDSMVPAAPRRLQRARQTAFHK
jgi:hypothetical protein